MIILLTPEYAADQELKTVIQLLDAGLDRLHIRKYEYTAKETAAYIRSIPAHHHAKLVLHTHHELAEEFDIKRIHYSERDRLELQHMPVLQGVQLSTSVHNIDTFNELEECWDYAFLSPFYPSISKPGYGATSTIHEQLAARNNQAVKLIALGGIAATNIAKTLSLKVDGVALLGAIWESTNPIKAFDDCRDALANTNNIKQ
ncbi:thiamine phosphate synthase [Sphingobacterium corticibacter]|uniref:Thiamine phosphate synthase n=1 Tax=Sphingobacterium corticibacter TaxID=2171749 RepID=A0A2T8HMU1_9SPHI|nr:thiamine phosphate synthase [Sphingobacterium corticibacter]PVH26761.1 thiamine phosphate synthase [Sphingobacterium corticibacter]